MNVEEFNMHNPLTKIYSETLASVSHDLKTPLSCIIASLEIFKRKELAKDIQTTLINTALEEAYKLDKIISTMLESATLNASRTELKSKPRTRDKVIADQRSKLTP
jgi:K+-sensing histidine kinase KdpD